MNKSTGKKNVLLLSTVEPILGTTKKDDTKRPAVIQLYNFTKGGTDIGKSKSCFKISPPEGNHLSQYNLISGDQLMYQTKLFFSSLYSRSTDGAI